MSTIPITLVNPIQKSTPQVPTEEALQKLLSVGEVDLVQQLVDSHKLKYRLEKDGDTWKLLGALTGTELWLRKFITTDVATTKLKDYVRKLAKVQDEVLITGETGTGKELIARAMIGDRQDSEKKGRFIAVNCAGLPTELVESELFGHAKGSFTGAVSDKQGMLQSAKDGVLFLDEIGELPLAVQGKLLRALQDKRVRRVGSNTEEEISCKFVCATHCNVKKMVEEGKFRQDLYARISTFELHINPLAERPSDIEPILLSLSNGKEFIVACSKHKQISSLDTSLNVRSLQQHVRRWTVLGRL